MIHVPHHVDMRIPFYGLPRAAESILEHYADVVRERRLRFADYLRATHRCKLFDFERGVWTGYDGQLAASAPQAAPARVV
jgi:omega-6 fatty acid desaturase (delta-12 desaturase)